MIFLKNLRKIRLISQEKIFFLLIQKISNKNKNKNIDWWVSPVGERNNYSSDLFHYLCLIETIHHLYKRNNFIEYIILDNPFC